jgi:hypothetical protein
MPFTIQTPADVPVVTLIHSGGQVLQEMGQVSDALISILDAQTERVFLILDVRGLTLGIDELTRSASFASLRPDALLHHPNIRENLVISTSGLVRLTAQGLQTATFGYVRLKVFESMEDAIDYCREQIITEAVRSPGNPQEPRSMTG